MSPSLHYPSDVAFTRAVKAIQSRKGSRGAYAHMEEGRGWRTAITSDLAAFIAEQTSVFFATASAAGQPYIQHRGGPPGFLRVIGTSTITFADFRGNRQYITQGNLAENPLAHLFLIDYASRRRVKLWGRARVIEGDEALLTQLAPEGYASKVEQAIAFQVKAWDENCPKHIPQRFDATEVAHWLEERDRRIATLEAELIELSAALRASG